MRRVDGTCVSGDDVIANVKRWWKYTEVVASGDCTIRDALLRDTTCLWIKGTLHITFMYAWSGL